MKTEKSPYTKKYTFLLSQRVFLNEKSDNLKRSLSSAYSLIQILSDLSKAIIYANQHIVRNQIGTTFFSIEHQSYQNKQLILHFTKIKPLLMMKQMQLELDIAKNFISKLYIWNEDIDLLKISYLNKRKLIENEVLLSNLKQVLRNKDKEILFRIVLLSREIDGIEIAASNAISILNFSGYNFHNKDLHGIKISGANLSRSFFYNTNFEGSNLTEVSFDFSAIESSNFKNCNLKDCYLGLKFMIKTLLEPKMFSPCRKYLLCHSRYCEQKRIEIWSLRKQERIINTTFRGCYSFSPYDNYFGYETSDGTIIQNLNTNEIIEILDSNDFTFSQNEKFIAYSSKNDDIWIFDIKEKSRLLFLKSDRNQKIILWSPCNKFVLLYRNGVAELWCLRSKSLNKKLDSVDYHIFSCNGRYLATYTNFYPKKSIITIEVLSNGLSCNTEIKNEHIESVEFSKLVEKLLLISLTNSCMLFNAESFEAIYQIPSFINHMKYSFLQSANQIICHTHREAIIMSILNQKCILTFGFRGNIVHNQYAITQKNTKFVFYEIIKHADSNLQERNKLAFLKDHINLKALSACYSVCGKYISIAYDSGKVNIWETSHWSLVKSLSISHLIKEILFFQSPIIWIKTCNGLSLWDFEEGAIIKYWDEDFKHFALSQCGNYFLLGYNKEFQIIKTHNFKKKFSSTIPDGSIISFFFFDKNQLAYVKDNGQIDIISLELFEIIKTLSLGYNNIKSLEFSSAKNLLVAYVNKNIAVLSLKNEDFFLEKSLYFASSDAFIKFSPCGLYLSILKNISYSFRVYDSKLKKLVFKCKKQKEKITSLSWHPYLIRVISIAESGAKIWNLEKIELQNKNKSGKKLDLCQEWCMQKSELFINNCNFEGALLSETNLSIIKQFKRGV